MTNSEPSLPAHCPSCGHRRGVWRNQLGGVDPMVTCDACGVEVTAGEWRRGEFDPAEPSDRDSELSVSADQHVPTLTLTDDHQWYTVRCSCDWGTARYPAPANDEWKPAFLRHVIDELRAEVERLTSSVAWVFEHVAELEGEWHADLERMSGVSRDA